MTQLHVFDPSTNDKKDDDWCLLFGSSWNGNLAFWADAHGHAWLTVSVSGAAQSCNIAALGDTSVNESPAQVASKVVTSAVFQGFLGPVEFV
jgi:hypothetical protein